MLQRSDAVQEINNRLTHDKYNADTSDDQSKTHPSLLLAQADMRRYQKTDGTQQNQNKKSSQILLQQDSGYDYHEKIYRNTDNRPKLKLAPSGRQLYKYRHHDNHINLCEL